MALPLAPACIDLYWSSMAVQWCDLGRVLQEAANGGLVAGITLLRNAALNSLKYKTELALVKSQNIDITNFEDELESFKSAFGNNYRLASEKFKAATGIDLEVSVHATNEEIMGKVTASGGKGYDVLFVSSPFAEADRKSVV